MSSLILTQQQNNVLTITLNNPKKKNALTHDMYQQLCQALQEAEHNPNVHCVIIQGSQTCFCAGNDIQDFADNQENLSAIHFIKQLTHFEKPLIASVAGPAIGIGCTLLLHCDIVIAANNSRFQLPFSQLGLCPEAGSSFLLTQKLGYNQAFELLILGQTFHVEKALTLNLINHVTSPDNLFSLSKKFAQQIAALPLTVSMGGKKLIRDTHQQATHHAIEQELTLFKKLLKTPHCQQILQQFLTSPKNK